MNVLVYAGPGTTIESVAQCTSALRALLSPHYAVSTIDAPALISDPWPSSTSLLAFPGGADLPYCRALDGAGTAKISTYVRRGGAFIGFCAGGYFGSARVEFEQDNPLYAVVGPRQLKFFPGTDRGTAFPGFVYDSESGARAAKIEVEKEALPELATDDENSSNDPTQDKDGRFLFSCYYNGGGVFVDADSIAAKNKNVTVLARYREPLQVEGGDAAIVHVKVGEGSVILTGPHPEFSPKRLRKSDSTLPPFYGDLVQRLLADDHKRVEVLKAMLLKLGMKVDKGLSQDSPPFPTTLYVTSAYKEDVDKLWSSLKAAEGLLQVAATHSDSKEDVQYKHVGENDTFLFSDASDSIFDMTSVAKELPTTTPDETKDDGSPQEIDLNKIVKKSVIYTHSDKLDRFHPALNQTPYFDHALYYKELLPPGSSRQTFGAIVQYAEVVTSTSTMLDRNISLLRHMPTGFTNVGSIQVAGRGRGGNVWVSPIGLLAFSIVIRHPVAVQSVAPLVFIQYIASLAIVEAIRTYGPGCEELDVRLKWPNDIYARNPAYNEAVSRGETDLPAEYVKLAGVLVNSNYVDNEYLLVVGCGINTANEAPSTSLNLLVAALNEKRRRSATQAIRPFKVEVLCARIMRFFEQMYTTFKTHGFAPFEQLYYSRWLHNNAVVRLDMYGGTKAVIKGISLDYGMLRVEELGFDGRPTGRKYTLQPDGNSFDMLQGLLKKKE
ncbi:biotin-protein ligase [Myxozyma melibiosi]|uniref:Biotin-protein ligase n=1 Tax=Myxozyma melibiosi TaxID=54550 RepID=A0ABR1F7V8_9ASCO